MFLLCKAIHDISKDEYVRDIWPFKELCEAIIEMCYKLDKECLDNNFIDNHNHVRTTGNEELFTYSYNNENVFISRKLNDIDLYFYVNKGGRALLSMSKIILDVYEIDMEDIELKVYL